MNIFGTLSRWYRQYRFASALQEFEYNIWIAAMQGVQDVLAADTSLGRWWYTGCSSSGPVRTADETPTHSFDFPEDFTYRLQDGVSQARGVEVELYLDGSKVDGTVPLLSLALQYRDKPELLDRLTYSILEKLAELAGTAGINTMYAKATEVPSQKSFSKSPRSYVKLSYKDFPFSFCGSAATDDKTRRGIIYHNDCNLHVR